MPPEKALEILRLWYSGEIEVDPQDLRQAVQSGIEALQRIQELRGYRTLIGAASSLPGRLLPSEEPK